jgi:hypothetical protein
MHLPSAWTAFLRFHSRESILSLPASRYSLPRRRCRRVRRFLRYCYSLPTVLISITCSTLCPGGTTYIHLVSLSEGALGEKKKAFRKWCGRIGARTCERFGVMGRRWDGVSIGVCHPWLVFVKVRRRRVVRVLHLSYWLPYISNCIIYSSSTLYILLPLALEFDYFLITVTY